MPPQVTKAGVGPGPVNQQPPSETSQTKSSDSKTKQVQPEKVSEDPNTAARTAEGSRNHATEQKSQQNVQAQVTQKNLQKQIPTTDKQNPTQTVDTTGLKPGEKISANVNKKTDGFHFEFTRPLTKEQAAAIIFQDGKVPANAKLEGSGKDWTVKIPNSLEDQQNALAHFNKREETTIIPPKNPGDVYAPDPRIINTWTGGDFKTTGPRQIDQRFDLKNDMGFTIKSHYALDPGQRNFKTLGLVGAGYEVAFDKPMTKAQVMEKLFDKEKVTDGQIRLVPKSKEPTTEWQVEVIGLDAVDAFKKEPGHASGKVGRAFSDASLYGKKSLPPDTPPGIRTHLENQTIPANAVKLDKPSKDGKDVYVWEQDGYMMYVKTNNKGKDGYYEPEPPTKMPTEKQGQQWMRQYVKENGMTPDQAWQTFWKDEIDVVRLQIGMISGAMRPISGNARVDTSRGRVSIERQIRIARGKPIPETPVPGSQRRMGTEPVPEGWRDPVTGVRTEKTKMITNTQGEMIEVSAAEYQKRIQRATDWIVSERAENPKFVPKGEIINHGPTKDEARRAAIKFGLDANWAELPSRPANTKPNPAMSAPKPPEPIPPAGLQRRLGEPAPEGWNDKNGVPRYRTTTITNSNGEMIQIPVAEYQRRVKLAEDWILKQRHSSPRPEPGPITPEEAASAARRFGLDADWSRLKNPKLS